MQLKEYNALELKKANFEKKIEVARKTAIKKILSLGLDIDKNWLEGIKIVLVPGREHCYWRGEDLINIGKMLMNSDREGEVLSTVIHEYCHALVDALYWRRGKRVRASHGKEFYELFVKICPKDIQHFELEYIRTSVIYGIEPPFKVN